jgi:hypothetical protein
MAGVRLVACEGTVMVSQKYSLPKSIDFGSSRDWALNFYISLFLIIKKYKTCHQPYIKLVLIFQERDIVGGETIESVLHPCRRCAGSAHRTMLESRDGSY